MWLLVPRGTRVRICFTIPSVSTVKKYRDGRFVGEVSVEKVQDRLYCAVETLEDVGAYGYVAAAVEGGYDVVNLHVYDPVSPPTVIDTFVVVTHEDGNPPEAAIVFGPDGQSQVGVRQVEAGVSVVGPVRLGVGAYWLKLRWADGMELVVPMFFRYLVPELVKRVYQLARRNFVLTILLFAGRARLLPTTIL